MKRFLILPVIIFLFVYTLFSSNVVTNDYNNTIQNSSEAVLTENDVIPDHINISLPQIDKEYQQILYVKRQYGHSNDTCRFGESI